MHKKLSNPAINVALVLIILAVVVSLRAADRHTLIINGESTDVPVIFVSGHPYVGLDALANAVHGSVSSSGVVIALSLPVSSPNGAPSPAAASAAPAPATQPQAAPSNQGFSKQFLNAGIEQMSTLREWHAALDSAIQNGIPLSAGLLAPYRAQATTNLRLAEVAAVTPSDHGASQLLNKAFQNMTKLADKYVNMRANMTFISPDALQNDALNQRLIVCGRSLRSMAANGQFVDDGSCE